jgi:uncharacterized protein YegL
MAFNPSSYKAPEAKKLPVILLLDVSGSMSGAKIDSLYDATVEMIETFAAAQAKEQIIDVAIITFGDEVKLHTRYTPVKDLQAKGIDRFRASGMTPMGTALRMAKDMIDDKQETPSRIYRPAVVLVSDGGPNDDWKGPMDKFITDGRSAKCQRFAVAIGNDADRGVLERFTQDPAAVLFAEDAKDISEQFKTISMSVSTRASSQRPNDIPTPASAPKFDNNTADNADDDEELY